MEDAVYVDMDGICPSPINIVLEGENVYSKRERGV
jgi:hypothetical protein